MDKESTGIGPLSSDDANHADAIENEIESIRGNLDGLVTELEHRRPLLSPIGVARKHPLAIALAGLTVLAAVAAKGVMTYRSRQGKQPSWLERGKRLTHAAGRLMSGKSIEQPPNIGYKVLAAAASATGALVVRRLVKRLLSRV